MATAKTLENISLSAAIQAQDLETTLKLLENNVDVNSWIAKEEPSPLHAAIATGNLEALCMLLCYGADVSIVYHNSTPIHRALAMKKYNAVEILLDYYDDEEFINRILFYLAVRHIGIVGEAMWCSFEPLNIDIDGIINWSPIFRIIFERESFHVFKYFWPKVTLDMLYNMEDPLLYTFFQTCGYSDAHLLECLYIMLESDMVSDIFYQYNDSTCLLWHMLAFLDNGKHDVSRSDRLGIIYAFLYEGIHLTLQDIVYVFNHDGYNEELMALVYAGELDEKIVNHQNYCILPITSFIFGLEENAHRRTVFKMFRNLAFRSFAIRPAHVERFMYYLRFFSFSGIVKERLVRLCYIHLTSSNSEIIYRIRCMHTMPSLLELSRNIARYYIKHKYNIKKPYQFHDVVKELNLPVRVKNIINYRTPIYD